MLVLLDRYDYYTFQPLLYQVATAGLEPDSVAGSLRQIIKENKHFHLRMLKVNGIDTDRKSISPSAGNLTYDFLIIATDSRINFYGNDSIAKHVFPLN